MVKSAATLDTSVNGSSGHEPRQSVDFICLHPGCYIQSFIPSGRFVFSWPILNSGAPGRSFSPSNAYVTENSPSVVFDPLCTPVHRDAFEIEGKTGKTFRFNEQKNAREIFLPTLGTGERYTAVVCQNVDYRLNCTLLPSK